MAEVTLLDVGADRLDPGPVVTKPLSVSHSADPEGLTWLIILVGALLQGAQNWIGSTRIDVGRQHPEHPQGDPLPEASAGAEPRRRGADIREIQDVLRHANISSTQISGGVAQETARRFMGHTQLVSSPDVQEQSPYGPG